MHTHTHTTTTTTTNIELTPEPALGSHNMIRMSKPWDQEGPTLPWLQTGCASVWCNRNETSATLILYWLELLLFWWILVLVIFPETWCKWILRWLASFKLYTHVSPDLSPHQPCLKTICWERTQSSTLIPPHPANSMFITSLLAWKVRNVCLAVFLFGFHDASDTGLTWSSTSQF